MKKNIIVAICIIIIGTIVGYVIGSNAVINSHKWVEEEGGLYIICTDFNGNVYEDVADKSSEHYNYFCHTVGRR